MTLLEIAASVGPALGTLAAGAVAGYQAARRRDRAALTAAPPPAPELHAPPPSRRVTSTGSFYAAPDPDVPRVLVIEDDMATAKALRRLLAEIGYAVDVAHDRADAMRLTGLYGYRAVIVDLAIPGDDGAELLEALRVRRIVYSGADEEQLAEIRGMDAVVPKPDAEALIKRLGALVPLPGALQKAQ